MAHVVENALHEAGRLGARQAKLAMDDIREVRPGERSTKPCFFTQTRDPEIRHNILPPLTASPRRAIR
jgi:hypothetical protein